jgi:hypothetical protein
VILELIKSLIYVLCTILKCKYKTLRKEREAERPSRGLYSRRRAVRYRKAAEAAAHCQGQQRIVEGSSALSRAAACC